MKKCSRCKLPKDEGEFNRDRSRPDGLNHRCKPCNTLHVKETQARQKQQLGYEQYRNKRRKYELSHYYGVSVGEYSQMVKKQKDRCAICQNKPERCLAIDHCHKTEIVRGLLCRKCNSAIGLFDDDIEKIRRALRYLLRAKKRLAKTP
jgi:hypothetical protein